MAAFRAGMENNVDALELDVHLSADGRLVVIHDPALARTTNETGLVSDYTLAELKTFDASARFFGPVAGRQEIPTLEEVIEFARAGSRGPVPLQIEIKVREDGSRYPGIEAEVLRVLELHEYVERATILSFDFPTLIRIGELEPRVPTCALVGKEYLERFGTLGPAAAAADIAALGVDSAGVRESLLGPELYAALRDRGLGIGAWTVDSPARMRRLAAMGVDFITSNRPDILLRELP